MIVIGLATGLIIGLIITIRETIDWGWDWVNILGILVTSALGTLLGFIISILTAALGAGIPMAAKGEPVRTELVALEDSIGVNGRFYLGHGYIESDQYYYYLTETPKGITQSKINANNNKVYFRTEDYAGTPYLLTQEYKCGNELIYFLSSGLLETIEYYFYIPPDSITHSYNIDLK